MRVSLLFVICLFIAGCPLDDLKRAQAVHSEIDNLKRSLGAYQYLGEDPQVEFNIAEFSVSPAKGTYGSPDAKYRIDLKQHNSDFPLASYSISARLHVLDGDGDVVDKFSIATTVTNGIASTSDVTALYGLQNGGKMSALKAVVADYSWWPESNLKPYIPPN